MQPVIKHEFQSLKGDGIDDTVVKPSDWNATHKIDVSAPSVVGGLIAGPATELPLTVGTSPDDGTVWTKKAVQDAIAAAISALPSHINIPVGSTIGWYTNTLPSGPWLFANGLTIGKTGSGATGRANDDVKDLFLYLWTLPNTFCPVLPARSATALADWNAGKTLGLPDECGRVAAGADNMGGVTTKGRLGATGLGVAAIPGAVGGTQLHVLVETELPPHKHDIKLQNAGLGGFGEGSQVWTVPVPVPASQVNTELAGGDPAATPPKSAAKGHINVQPTVVRNVIIRY